MAGKEELEMAERTETDAKPQRQRGPAAPPDPEVAAMAALVRAMGPLEEDQRDRVREWFAARYGDTSAARYGDTSSVPSHWRRTPQSPATNVATTPRTSEVLS